MSETAVQWLYSTHNALAHSGVCERMTACSVMAGRGSSGTHSKGAKLPKSATLLRAEVLPVSEARSP